MQNSSTAISSGTDIFSSNVTVSNTLQDAMKNSGSASSSATGLTAPDSSSNTISIISDKIDLSTEDVAVFKAK